ncbi:MAG TPA: LPS assembly protein LptD [Alphaproteobacteria bacterium]|nr:LPS assembly protein LptD [Alphaproteobacteria bacterium]
MPTAWGADVSPSSADNSQPFDLNADTVSYESSPTRVVAHGNVVVSSTDGVLQTPELSYYPDTGRVLATGGVTYTNPQNQVVKADTLELTDNFRTGAANKLTMAVPAIGDILTAESAIKVSGTEYELKNATYSPCKKCEGRVEPWGITATKVTYDTSESKVTYRNAVFKVRETPVMYLPYFSNTVGPKQPKTGLLLPTLGHSSDKGLMLGERMYIWSPRENADYTLGAKYMSARGVQYSGERRQVTDNTESEIRGNYLNDLDQQSRPRGYGQVMFQQVLQPGMRVGINAERASDRTYLNEYFGRTDPYLPSTVYGESGGNNHYYALTATHFENLSSTTPAATTPQILPHLQLEQTMALGDAGDTLTFSGDAMNLSRQTGTRYRRMVGMAAYDKPMLWADGSKLTAGATLRGDYYNVDGSANNGTVFRGLPEATLLWTKPYASPSGYHTIAPTVLGAISPRGGNPTGIPNEDSVGYELDAGNLFEPSRYAGIDRVETGPRVVYGLDNRWGNARDTQWRLFLGQGIRKYDDNRLPINGGAATAVSDWIAASEANPNEWLDFHNQLRLDNSDLTVRRADSGVRIGEYKKTRLILNHSYLQNGPNEINADFQMPLNQQWTFITRARQDIANSTLLEGEVGFRLFADCYQIDFTARRHGFENADLQPSTDYLVNVKLLTFGSGDSNEATGFGQSAENRSSLDTMRHF